MIKFLDIRGCGTGSRFQFVDSVTGKIFQIDGEEEWSTKEEFLDSASMLSPEEQKRFVQMMPDWVSDEPKDEEL